MPTCPRLRARIASTLLLAALMGCGPRLTQERLDVEEDITFNTRWNDIDAHESAVALVESCLDSHWLPHYAESHRGKRPIVIVSKVENRTDEHIDVSALTNEIRTELVNSGRVRFLEAKARDTILKEYNYQQSGLVRADQAKSGGNQLGSDFLMLGEISSITSELDKQKLVTYQVDLRLTNLITSEIEWVNTHKIKKLFERRGHKP